ncbi:N-acetylglucosaminyldiphosphoundecaprenol N-acetyl-beta-D-mannosaminyltransferase [Cnuella takakiae]|uniref:N-acetylglucosaminyldiphosphoundecaprenol N-acetyl-beta-D-mannosaminyltransferase n=2 Tax=Cnuella takakiae TaxID=1302690 RepID=A0A1M4YFL4_9BACT|nr:glycosyltransferase [Cnuella takakiae]SHF04256.1 N-acetylglucosaminyldiphosphoundecaprenol N-acetyl-beta-D-mannosaminyltransferase [Cnuella takakiae]
MVKVLHVKLFDQGMNEAFQQLRSITLSGAEPLNKLVSFTGAHGLVTANQDPKFKKLLDSFHWNMPDGKPGVWVGKLKGRLQMQQIPGPNFFELVIRNTAADPQIKHFFCGGKEGVADELKAVCNSTYHNPNVTGTFCPPFRQMSHEEMVALGKAIDESGANLVWIGLSTPKQEMFAARLKQYTKVQFILCVGAAFDFHTGRVKYAPNWMLHAGLGWLYRTLKEPKRLAGRYAQIIPLFFYYNIKSLINSPTSKNNKTIQA